MVSHASPSKSTSSLYAPSAKKSLKKGLTVSDKLEVVPNISNRFISICATSPCPEALSLPQESKVLVNSKLPPTLPCCVASNTTSPFCVAETFQV